MTFVRIEWNVMEVDDVAIIEYMKAKSEDQKRYIQILF